VAERKGSSMTSWSVDSIQESWCARDCNVYPGLHRAHFICSQEYGTVPRPCPSVSPSSALPSVKGSCSAQRYALSLEATPLQRLIGVGVQRPRGETLVECSIASYGICQSSIAAVSLFNFFSCPNLLLTLAYRLFRDLEVRPPTGWQYGECWSSLEDASRAIIKTFTSSGLNRGRNGRDVLMGAISQA
jgi:hypothetical protein